VKELDHVEKVFNLGEADVSTDSRLGRLGLGARYGTVAANGGSTNSRSIKHG